MVKLGGLRLIPVLALAAAITLPGCIWINSSSITGKEGPGGTAIAGSASDMGFLHLIAPTNLTGTADSQLVSSCQSGKFDNVQTELSTRDFFGIVQMYMVNTTANCH